jgi:thioesterase domain-containing protein
MDLKPAADADPLELVARHFAAMPPVAALQLRVDGFDGHALRLSAPLSAHVNDKGCAFGGSLASLMTLAAWGVLTLRLHAIGIQADVFVADSQVQYRAPLFSDLQSLARLASEADWDGFVARLRERGRAGIALEASVLLPGGGIAATGQSRYVAIAKG